eukprot:GEMP01038116.1.p1 GENE.GEMP01038116.1~~GEMP01038116.1.p1  ORF type:complete len:256 (+),score=58.75 GEMP01038116.1:437-1204(+)
MLFLSFLATVGAAKVDHASRVSGGVVYPAVNCTHKVLNTPCDKCKNNPDAPCTAHHGQSGTCDSDGLHCRGSLAADTQGVKYALWVSLPTLLAISIGVSVGLLIVSCLYLRHRRALNKRNFLAHTARDRIPISLRDKGSSDEIARQERQPNQQHTKDARRFTAENDTVGGTDQLPGHLRGAAGRLQGLPDLEGPIDPIAHVNIEPRRCSPDAGGARDTDRGASRANAQSMYYRVRNSTRTSTGSTSLAPSEVAVE